jgi:hypothetical protein
VGVPVIRAGAVEAGVDQDGEVFEVGYAEVHGWIVRGKERLILSPDHCEVAAKKTTLAPLVTSEDSEIENFS